MTYITNLCIWNLLLQKPSGDHSPLSKNINLPSAPKYSAKQNNVFQHAGNAAVSAAANIIHSPSASVSQVNLARIASDRMSSENASIRRLFIGGTMVNSLTESKNFAGGRAGENTAGTHAMKLDIIIENQEEIKAMLRSLVAVSRDDVSDDVFPQKMKNEHKLRQLEIKLKDPSFRKKMINYFGSLVSRNCKDVIRRIMRTTATNQLWSLFSFNGRKGKLSFESCLLCQVVMKACKKIIKDANDQKIEDEIREVLKHAPNRPGGVNYEAHELNCFFLSAKIVTNTPKKDVLLRQAEESSDSENTN
ncbi:uncharacterized protein LOC136083003 [Hydra vulgaris]|uniref:Uncharacterized protein LOC136083003 n=1 Tax=Hydra vulgaris TaxID=6087 RepID=A0ABM4C9Z8_HYDVU